MGVIIWYILYVKCGSYWDGNVVICDNDILVKIILKFCIG